MSLDFVILVIASRTKLYDSFKNLWAQYAKSTLRIRVYFIYSGDHPHTDTELYFPGKESLCPGILNKTLQAFEYVNQHHTYTHLLRTNLSSFYHFPRLLSFQTSLPLEQVYCAVKGRYKNIVYGSGAGFILSPDLVQYIVKHQRNLEIHLPDDVAIGKLLWQYPIIPSPRIDFTNHTSSMDPAIQRKLEQLKNGKSFHCRIKNPGHRDLDLVIYEMCSKKIYLQ